VGWNTLTEDDIRSRLSAVEMSALKTVETVHGQNVILDLISQVTDEVRGYVSAHSLNSLGSEGTIPSRLITAAASLVRFRLITRLPINSDAILRTRETEYRDAMTQLRDVASGKFAVDDAEPSSEEERFTGSYGSSNKVF